MALTDSAQDRRRQIAHLLAMRTMNPYEVQPFAQVQMPTTQPGTNLINGLPFSFLDPKDHSPTASFGSTPDFQGGLPSARDTFDIDRAAGWGWGAEDNLSDPTMTGGAPTPTPGNFAPSAFSPSTTPTFAPFSSYDDTAVPAPPGDFVTTAPMPEYSPTTPGYMPEFNPDTNPPGGFPTAPSEQNTGIPIGWGGVDFASLGGMSGMGGLGGLGGMGGGGFSGVDFGSGGTDYGGSSESGSSGVG